MRGTIRFRRKRRRRRRRRKRKRKRKRKISGNEGSSLLADKMFCEENFILSLFSYFKLFSFF